MSSEDSSNEEFFDCESPNKIQVKRYSKSQIEVNHGEFSDTKLHKEEKPKDFQLNLKIQQQQLKRIDDDFKFVEPKNSGRQRFRDLKNSINNDEDDLGLGNTPDSQNSSAKSVDAASKATTKHPFRVIENDAMSIQSMTSLGRVGRILSGSLDPSIASGRGDQVLQQQSQRPLSQSSSCGNSNSSSNATITVNSQNEKLARDGDSTSQNSDTTECSTTRSFPLQEPDVIASTKLAPSKTTDSVSVGPVPPPRRKKHRKISSSSSEQFFINESAIKPIPTQEKSGEEQLSIVVPPITPQAQLAAETISEPKISDKILPSPGTLLAITKEIESSFSEASTSTSQSDVKMSRASTLTGSMKQISLESGVDKKDSSSSPTNVKSNSAPGRVCSSAPIDPNQSLNIFKATQGKYVVKPEDDIYNKAEGPQLEDEDIERINKIRSEVFENTIINGSDRSKFSNVGSNSLGSSSKYNSSNTNSEKSLRRKSAGDEDFLKQLNVYVRTRTDSGKPLTDMEILEQVPVKNLDTGETLPLSTADEKLPQCINPLSLHIMRLTSHIPESDEESVGPPPGSEAPPEEEEEDIEPGSGGRLKRKTARIKKFISNTAKKAANTAKTFAQEVSHARHKEDVADIVDVVNPEQNIKIKASKTNTGPYEFAKLQHVQDLSGEHQSAVWCMKFSSCGRLLATAGQDKVLRIWVLKDAFQFFQDMRTKYNAEKSSPTPSQESLVSHHSFEEQIQAAEKSSGPFMPKSFCSYTGHTSDLLDVSWSKNYFILSSSMDKTVRLWHISRKECLCCFQHIDFVTAICFHPRDDRYFLSGSLDGKLRLWNIPDKKVALWNEVDGQTKLITAANFCQNGKFAVVGSYDGRCLFYNTDQLKYHTQIHVRSTRGKNSTGRKISGIEPMPGEDKILITSNDSRIRLYDLRDLNLSCKYKGYLNVSSQIKASFSHDGKYIISGSENQCIYIWKTHHDYAKLSSVRRDRSDFWEGIKAHNATVTCAIFAPHPEAIIKPEVDNELSEKTSSTSQPEDPLVEQRKKGCGGYVLVSADFNGCIKVFINKTKPKHSSLPYTALD